MSIAELIAKRDNIDLSVAEEMVAECREEILHSSPFEADYILMDLLGLEPDYMFQIIGY